MAEILQTQDANTTGLDTKILATALWYIRKHSMNFSLWKYTLIEDTHPEVLRLVRLESNELPIVSFFFSEENWYLLTTRRVISHYAGQQKSVGVLDVAQHHYENFKGFGRVELELMTLRLTDGSEIVFQYETNFASMAIIYYFMYWYRKFPILDRLKVNQGVVIDAKFNR